MVKRDINGAIEEDDEEDAISSDDDELLDEEGKTDGNGFIVIDKAG